MFIEIESKINQLREGKMLQGEEVCMELEELLRKEMRLNS